MLRNSNIPTVYKVIGSPYNRPHSNKEMMMSKHLVLIRDVVSKYHPEFRKSADLRRYALRNPTIFNVERLIEESLAAVGGYEFVDEDGRDFNCNWNSDSKTTTVIQDGRSKTAAITGIESKIGSLRVTIYNPFRDRVDFMYIPRHEVAVLSEPCYGRKNSAKERLRARWSEAGDHYNFFNMFRKKSFEELALAGG